MERERILLQYFYQFIAEPATSGSRKQRLKMANFNWTEKCHQIAQKTEGMSGRELSKLVLGWQVNICIRVGLGGFFPLKHYFESGCHERTLLDLADPKTCQIAIEKNQCFHN